MADMINIEGLNKVKVLQALWVHSKEQGLSFLGSTGDILTEEKAEEYVSRGYCDYVNGRVIKAHLEKDEFDSWGYDRDNGQGAAQEAIDDLRNNPSKYRDDDSIREAFGVK